MAVVRGKTSEAIDSVDATGRLVIVIVIVIGIPYPSYVHPWISMKKVYMDYMAKGPQMDDWELIQLVRNVLKYLIPLSEI